MLSPLDTGNSCWLASGHFTCHRNITLHWHIWQEENKYLACCQDYSSLMMGRELLFVSQGRACPLKGAVSVDTRGGKTGGEMGEDERHGHGSQRSPDYSVHFLVVLDTSPHGLAGGVKTGSFIIRHKIDVGGGSGKHRDWTAPCGDGKTAGAVVPVLAGEGQW